MDRFLTKTANKCQKSPIKSNFLSVFGGIGPSRGEAGPPTPPYNRSAASDSARRNRKRCFLTATSPIQSKRDFRFRKAESQALLPSGNAADTIEATVSSSDSASVPESCRRG